MAHELRALLSQLEELQMAKAEDALLDVPNRIGALDEDYRQIIGWVWAGGRQRHELVEDATEYANLECEHVRLGQGEKKRHENSIACWSVTKGHPLFNIGSIYVVPAPVELVWKAASSGIGKKARAMR